MVIGIIEDDNLLRKALDTSLQNQGYTRPYSAFVCYGNIRNYGEQSGGRKAMKITREADYALRIIAMLADENRQIEAKAIAEKNDIPYRFTLKILRKIVQAGIMFCFHFSCV